MQDGQLQQQVKQLHQQQLRDFPLARENYAALRHVQYREIPMRDFSIRIQYNPARILSTTAKVDAESLQQRPCFLCHRPAEQQGLPYAGRYHIFVNPYPIFKEHYTIPDRGHVPQRLGVRRFRDLLNLAIDLQGYTVFYNGPACGASAPDHFHFQMAPQNNMPLEEDVNNGRLRETLIKAPYYRVFTLRHYLREVIVLQASDLLLLTDLFLQLQAGLGRFVPCREEPMMNIVCWFDNCQWTVCVFPRTTLRPWQYFAEDDEQTLFSPGCVDMAGLIIAPRKADFDKYSAPLLTDLFDQVTTEHIAYEIFH